MALAQPIELQEFCVELGLSDEGAQRSSRRGCLKLEDEENEEDHDEEEEEEERDGRRH